MVRIRKKYWTRLKKKKLRDISEINEEKKEIVRKKIRELETLRKCGKIVKDYNKSRRK
ncbi:hypothetical protein LCGC14_1317950 [marine sediment metagenome]|uniref:Uncharacterized protein n=1 Tax=marine sediment metagenome TaxID=412755 RepID=A0A0F9KKE8_9ZZZZ